MDRRRLLLTHLQLYEKTKWKGVSTSSPVMASPISMTKVQLSKHLFNPHYYPSQDEMNSSQKSIIEIELPEEEQKYFRQRAFHSARPKSAPVKALKKRCKE